MGISRGAFIKLERGERRLNEDSIDQAARAFAVDAAEIIKDVADVAIIGLVGADATGSKITFVNSGELGRAAMPPNGSEKTVAVEVRGNSMRGIADDGYIIYYEDVRSPLTDDMLGELCVLWLTDGRVLIKKPFHSRSPGLFDLESANGPTMREQQVETGAFVTAIIPRRFAIKG